MTIPANLRPAIDDCLLSSSHLASQLDAAHPPASASLPDGIRHYGAESLSFQLWAAWRGIERLRVAWGEITRAEQEAAQAARLEKQDQ